MSNIKNIKENFDFFKNNPKLIYLDSGATTIKLNSVLEATKEYYSKISLNDRSTTSEENSITNKINLVREEVANFINAKSNEIVFTSGATESLNQIAYLVSSFLKPGEEIILNYLEHSSNFLPWKRWGKKAQANFKYVNIEEDSFVVELENLKSLINDKTRVIALASTFNTTGSKNNLSKIIKEVKQINPNVIFSIDATQSMGYSKIDVKNLDIDFLALSAHKMYGPTGVGVMFGKYNLLEQGEPLLLGGGMNMGYEEDIIFYEKPPLRYEAGTKNIAGILGFSESIKFIDEQLKLNSFERILELQSYAIKELLKIDQVNVKNPLVNSTIAIFDLKKSTPKLLSEYLASKGIIVRSGNSCVKTAENTPLQINDFVRISFNIYNEKSDIDILIKEIRNFFEGDSLKEIFKDSNGKCY